MEMKLTIEGQPQALSAAWALRWVETDAGQSEPVLYRDGRRVTRPWALELRVDHPADRFGSNGNTD